MSVNCIMSVDDIISPLSSSHLLYDEHVDDKLCFICDSVTNDESVQLQFGETTHSKTGLPIKLGQLIGEEFMVIVSVDDRLCFPCIKLINLADKLEIKLNVVKKAITEQLKTKYQLSDGINNRCLVSNIDDLISNGNDCDDSEIDDNIGNETENQPLNNAIKIDSLNGKNKLIDQSDSDVEIFEVIEEKTDNGELKKKNVNINSANGIKLIASKCSDQSQLHTKSEIISKDKDCTKIIKNKMNSYNVGYETNVKNKPKLIQIKKDIVCNRINNRSKFKSSKSSFNQPVFKCNICEEEFYTQVLLRKHTMSLHSTKWSCNFCSVVFNNGNDYQNHMKTHVKNVRVQLQTCDKVSISNEENDLSTEEVLSLDQHNKITFFKCNNCKFKTKFKIMFDKHESECCLSSIWNKHFKCSSCMNSFKSMKQLNMHVCNNDSIDNFDIDGSSKSTSNFKCGVCSLKFINKTYLIQHLRNHKDKKLFENSVKEDLMTEIIQVDVDLNTNNNSNDADVSSIQENNDRLTSSGLFHCEVCSLVFDKEISYKEHNCSKKLTNNKTNELYFDNVEHFMALSSESGPLSDKDSTLNLNVIEGMYNDTKTESSLILITSFVCDTCSMSFTNKSDLDHHIVLYDHKFKQNLNDFKYNLIPSDNNMDCKDFKNDEKIIDNKNDCIIESQFVNEIIINSLNSKQDDNEIIDKKLGNSIPCQLCSYIASSINELKNHEVINHNVINDMIVCNICNKFINKSDENEHYNSHKTIFCNYCSFETKSRKLMIKHIKEHGSKNYGRKEKLDYLCQYCSETFKTKKLLKLHEELHPENFEYHCDKCDKKFMKEKQLKNHYDEVHRDPHCCYCGKEILNLKALKNHEQRHIRDFHNSNKLECDICKRVFKTRTGLRHHFAVHTGKFKYFCDFCQRGFMSRMMLEEHRSRHTKEDRYVCDVCGRKFTFQSTYWIHRKWHDNPFPYKCNYCGRLFRHTSLLAVHKRKHTGERPYKCLHCPLSFTVGGTLKRHMILHTQKFPFWCEICKRGFTTKHKYSVHLSKMHNNDELMNDKRNSKKQTEFKMVVKEKSPGLSDDSENKKSTTARDQTDNFEFMPDSTNFTLVNMEEDDAGNSAVMMPCIMTTVNNEENSGLVFEIISGSPLQQISNSITLQENTILPDMWCQ